MAGRVVLVVLAVIATSCGRLGFDTNTADSVTEDPDLLAYWPFDEPSGSSQFFDASRFHNDGDCSDCPTAGVPGVRGTAIDFGAAQAGIKIYDNTPISMASGPLTISAWVRMAVNDQYGAILSNVRDCCAGTTNGFALYGSHYATGPALLTWSQAQASLVRPMQTLPIGTWTHVVGTFDGTFNRVYVNGIEVRAANSAGYATPFDYPTWIGAVGYQGASYHLTGSLDELLIFGRALQASEVAALYATYPPP